MDNYNGINVHQLPLIKQYIEKNQYTIAVTGSARGGTSLLGYFFNRMGYDMGVKGTIDHEDPHFLPNEWENIESIKSYINKRNEEKSIWGFKMPHIVQKLEFLSQELRNPIFIIIYRNPISVMNSIISRDNQFFPDESELARCKIALNFAISNYQFSLDVFESNKPFILVDYEKVKKDPYEFVIDMIDILELKGNQKLIKDIAKNIEIPGYKQA